MAQNLIKGNSLTKEILFMAAVSPVVLSSLFMPNAAQLLKPIIKWHNNWDKIQKRRIYEAIRRLNQKRLVRLVEKGNDTHIEITESGNKIMKILDYDALEAPHPKKWDKKWRLVIFDIPEKKKKERNAISAKLKDMGFCHFQESAYIYPYDCQDEVDFVCEFLSVSQFVNYFIVESVGKKEGDLRQFFDLSLFI